MHTFSVCLSVLCGNGVFAFFFTEGQALERSVLTV